MRAGRGKGHSQPTKEKSKHAKNNWHHGDLNAPAKPTNTGGSQSFFKSARSSGVHKRGRARTKVHNKGNYINEHSTQLAENQHEVNELLTQQVVTNHNKDDLLPEVVRGQGEEKHIPGLESLAKTVSQDQTSYSSDGRTPGGFDYLNACFDRIHDHFEQMNRRMSNIERYQQMILAQQIMIMNEVKRLHAEMGPGGQGSDYMGGPNSEYSGGPGSDYSGGPGSDDLGDSGAS